MWNEHKGRNYAIILSLLIVVLTIANMLVGSVEIPPSDVWHVLIGEPVEKASWEYIVWESRFPQCITALMSGASLAVCGLLLQTTFGNPLAGPSILGIDAGASLGVALVMLASGGTLLSGVSSAMGMVGVLLGALSGSLFVMGVILFLSTLIRSNIMLLIVGIMIGYVTSSAISLLNFFASSEGVQAYMLWGLGNFGGVTLQQLPWYVAVVGIGLFMAVLLIKPLNALLLGYRYAENLGINIRRIRQMLLLTTGLLTAVTTAFCGPVSFIGLAVPHVARLMLGTSNHNSLLPVTMLAGSAVALLCHLICLLPGENGVIPLNAVTPVLGAPIVIYVILNQRRIQYFN